MTEVSHEFGPTLTDTQAMLEASRCLLCDDPPCEAACPAHVPVKHFIRAIRFDNPRRAINLIRERNVLAGICGLACPVERLCVGACRSSDLTTPIAIGRLQHYAAVTDFQSDRSTAPAGDEDREKVAVIGGGPSGLAAAAELASRGHKPVVFEQAPRAGGICTYGVPAQRIPNELVAAEVEHVKALGAEIQTSTCFGRDVTLDDLLASGYRACYLAVGAQQSNLPPVPGTDLDGVTTWKPLLNACSASHLGEGAEPELPPHVIVVGAGGVAMDVATTVLHRTPNEVDIVCLEAPNEMPADEDELAEVRDMGARFHTRSLPIEITGEGGKVTGLRAVRIRWQVPDRFVPENAVPIAGTEYWLPGEMVVFATGARPAPDLADALPGVDTDKAGFIQVNPETGATSRPGVYAGGDAVAGGGTTIVASVAEGVRAARAIDAYIRGL